MSDDMKKERDYFAEQSKIAQKLVGTYRAEVDALRSKLAIKTKAANTAEEDYGRYAEEAGKIARDAIAKKVAAEARAEAAEKDRDEWCEAANKYDTHLNRVAKALSRAGVLPIDELSEKVDELARRGEKEIDKWSQQVTFSIKRAEAAEKRAEKLLETIKLLYQELSESRAEPIDLVNWTLLKVKRALAADSAKGEQGGES